MIDGEAGDSQSVHEQPAEKPDGEKTRTKRRRPIRRMFVGGIIGGSLGMIVLLVLVALVIVQGVYSATNPTEGTSVAWSFAGVASTFVCFGLPAILICTVLGVLGGLIRSLW